MEKVKPGDKPTQTDNIVLTCMDHRYQEAIREILMAKHNINIDHVDRLAIGGASAAIVDGSMMPSIHIAVEKHKAKNLYIFDHIDCGGFGGQAAFDNDVDKEAQAHFESIDRAKEAVHKVLPEIVIVSYVVGLDGEPIYRPD
jgi:carbonic anhydrase